MISLMSNMFKTCSGYGIAAQALTAVIRAYDGRGPPTMLTTRILKALGLSSPEEIIGYMTIINFILVVFNCCLFNFSHPLVTVTKRLDYSKHMLLEHLYDLLMLNWCS